MAIRGGPDLIERGLVLMLDAGNRRSFPGTGTTWFDISGNNLDASLVNGIAFGTDSTISQLGYLVFEGAVANDYARILYTPILTPSFITIGVWVHSATDWPSGLNNERSLISKADTGGYNITLTATNGFLRGNIYANGAYRTATTTFRPTAGMRYICMTYDGTQVKMFIDGIKQAETIPATFATMTYSSNNALQIAAEASSGTTPTSGTNFPGNISMIHVHDTALTDAEIYENYIRTRYRYNVSI